MAFAFFDNRAEVTLDEFANGLAPAVFEQAFRETGLPSLGLDVRGQRDTSGRLASGVCVVLLRRELTPAQQRQLRLLVRAHAGGDPLQDSDPRLQDLGGSRFGASTIRYVRKAPKIGEPPDAGTGTHVYRDPDGNWRRLADDAVLRGSTVRP